VDRLHERWMMEFKKEIKLGIIQMKYLLQRVNLFVFQISIIKWPQETQCSFWSAALAISLHKIIGLISKEEPHQKEHENCCKGKHFINQPTTALEILNKLRKCYWIRLQIVILLGEKNVSWLHHRILRLGTKRDQRTKYFSNLPLSAVGCLKKN